MAPSWPAGSERACSAASRATSCRSSGPTFSANFSAENPRHRIPSEAAAEPEAAALKRLPPRHHFPSKEARMNSSTRFCRTLVLCAGLLLAAPALAVVNGTEAGNPQFQAVVSLGGCTGTFIHPRFILTAAHCIRKCSGPADTGCVTGSAIDVVNGAAGRDGAVSMTARDGVTPGSGTAYAIDFV